MSNCLGLFVACIHILPCVFWTEIANSKYLRIICCMKLTNGVALNSFRLSKILCRIKFTIYWHSTSDIPGERIANLNIRIETKKFVGFIWSKSEINVILRYAINQHFLLKCIIISCFVFTCFMSLHMFIV